MSRRAQSSGISLSAADAALIKGMLNRGDRQHDIAAWFGVNGGRIAEVANGSCFRSVTPAVSAELPPQGPYQSGRAAHAAIVALADARAALIAAENAIRSRAA